MKTCNRCKIKKDFPFFPKEGDSVATVCKDCKNITERKRYQVNRISRLQKMAEDRIKNPEKYKEKYNKYYSKHKDEIVIRRNIDRIKNPEKYRKYWLKARYNITPQEYDSLFSSQEGRCLICNIHSTETSKGLVVDHCHNTNRIRGLLCSKCNTGIGQFNENVTILERAITYINKHK